MSSFRARLHLLLAPRLHSRLSSAQAAVEEHEDEGATAAEGGDALREVAQSCAADMEAALAESAERMEAARPACPCSAHSPLLPVPSFFLGEGKIENVKHKLPSLPSSTSTAMPISTGQIVKLPFQDFGQKTV